MKKVTALFIALALGYAIAWAASAKRSRMLTTRHAQREVQWLAEKGRLEAELVQLRNRTALAAGSEARPPAPAGSMPEAYTPTLETPSAQNVIARLQHFGLDASTDDSRKYRQLISELERLVEVRPAAIPAIRDFLRQNRDVVMEQREGPPAGKGPKWKQDTAAPPSIRAGLIETLARVGGPDAEQLLRETLSATTRGYEVLAIARALEAMAPGKHRAAVLTAAQHLLAETPTADPATRLDEHTRDYLYDVLAEYGNAATVAQVSRGLLS
nr:hypothetical protein [Verrucomicrobiota bacterium]